MFQTETFRNAAGIIKKRERIMSNKNNADNLSLDSWLKKKCTEMFLKVCLVFRGHAPSAPPFNSCSIHTSS